MVSTGFSALDTVTGGIRGAKDYLVYGGIGGGKSTFGLGFLYQGLVRGEAVALVVRRSAEAVLGHARAFGWDLEPYLRSAKLLLIEYPEGLDERTSKLREGSEIVQEFRTALQDTAVERVVFDPATPLFSAASGASSLRLRSLLASIAELNATTLYVVDVPEGEVYLSGCKDQVYGVLRMEAGGRSGAERRASLERMPGVEAGRTEIAFELRSGVGQVELAPPLFAAEDHHRPAMDPMSAEEPLAGPNGRVHYTYNSSKEPKKAWRTRKRMVAIADADTQRRQTYRLALEGMAKIIEAPSAAECLSLIHREAPDLFVLSSDLRGIGAADLTRKLRSNGHMAPIVIFGNKLGRLSDRVRVMGAGADLVLPLPVDVRMLKLHVRNLLGRCDSNQLSQAEFPALDGMSEPVREPVFCITSAAELQRRFQEEVRHSQRHDLPLAVVTLRAHRDPIRADEIAAVCACVSRKDDLIFLGDTGVAVLLPEAETADPFLERFERKWRNEPAVKVECDYFDGTDAFLESITRQIFETIGTRDVEAGHLDLLQPLAPASNGARSNHNGHHKFTDEDLAEALPDEAGSVQAPGAAASAGV